MELGGKSPLIVFEDADIDSAIGGAMLGNFYSTGQVCSNGTRVFVNRKIKPEFLKRLKTRTEAMIIGDPMDEATQVGPMVLMDHHEMKIRVGTTWNSTHGTSADRQPEATAHYARRTGGSLNSFNSLGTAPAARP